MILALEVICVDSKTCLLFVSYPEILLLNLEALMLERHESSSLEMFKIISQGSRIQVSVSSLPCFWLPFLPGESKQGADSIIACPVVIKFVTCTSYSEVAFDLLLT